MINTANLNEARKQIQNTKEKPIIVKSQNPEFDRKILEFGNFNILLSVEKIKGKDNSKYLNSGLNHVLAKIAAKNKIAMGINIEEISRLEKKQKALLLSIIKQNIKTCRKAQCKIALLNYKDQKDAQNLFTSLGASTKQAKEATDF